MKQSSLPYFLTLLLIVGASYGFWRLWADDFSQDGDVALAVGAMPLEQEKPELISEFSLDERNGETFDSKSMQGKVWVASFFFSNCPGSCLRLNQALADLHTDEEFSEVKLLSITCDPDNDSLEVLRNYADRFQADPVRWLFCRGEMPYIQQIGTDVLKISVKKQTHSDRAVIVDRSGLVRGRFVLTDPNQLAMLRRVLAKCLGEPAPG